MTRESYYNDPANRPLLLSKSCVGSMPSSVRNSAILKRWAGTPATVSLSATPFGPFHPKPPEVTLQGWQRRVLYECADTKLHNIFLRLYHGDSKYSLLNCKELVSHAVSEFVYSDAMWSPEMWYIEGMVKPKNIKAFLEYCLIPDADDPQQNLWFRLVNK